EKVFLRVVDIYERLETDDPDVIAHPLNRGRTISNLGYLAMQDGRHANAVDYQIRAVKILATVQTRAPGLAAARELVRNAHGGGAMAHFGANQFAEPVKAWDEALAACSADDRAEIIIKRDQTLLRLNEHARAYTEVVALDEAKQIAPLLLIDSALVC